MLVTPSAVPEPLATVDPRAELLNLSNFRIKVGRPLSRCVASELMIDCR
jgi:hypothetical protein